MELTNKQRRCLGLIEVEDTWTREEKDGQIWYFDHDVICKIIDQEDRYYESNLRVKTSQNKTMLCPKTSKGKARKLTKSSLSKITREGVYFSFQKGYVTIANFTTQSTYYSSIMAGLDAMNEEELASWLNTWVKETDESLQKDIQAFAIRKRKHCKYKEGDFFRYRLDRNHYGYGRIIYDVLERKKQGYAHWDVLMGHPLIVQVFHMVTKDSDVPIAELLKLQSCPSQYIMDNAFYYGEYEIIGNQPLPDDIDYPILYGRSISMSDKDKIVFQRGPIYKEIRYKNNLISDKFRNNGIGWSLDINKRILEQCIQVGNNSPYWNRKYYSISSDVRNPEYKEMYEKILAQMVTPSTKASMKDKLFTFFKK